ncbi:MAG: hypothetical protein AAF125_05995 [Chloroflexota bacterium]
MPMQHDWILQDRIIYTRAVGNFTKADMLEVKAVSDEMIAAGKPLTHHIGDASHITKIDMGVQDMWDVMFAKVTPLPNRGWTISVTPSAVQRFLGSLMGRYGQLRQRNVATVDEALAFLADQDNTLPKHDTLLEAYKALDATMIAKQNGTSASPASR